MTFLKNDVFLKMMFAVMLPTTKNDVFPNFDDTNVDHSSKNLQSILRLMSIYNEFQSV